MAYIVKRPVSLLPTPGSHSLGDELLGTAQLVYATQGLDGLESGSLLNRFYAIA